jgi:hypothetical protein
MHTVMTLFVVGLIGIAALLFFAIVLRSSRNPRRRDPGAKPHLWDRVPGAEASVSLAFWGAGNLGSDGHCSSPSHHGDCGHGGHSHGGDGGGCSDGGGGGGCGGDGGC